MAFFNAAALYLRDRRFREALAYLDQAVQLTPEDDAALTNRGITLVLLNESNVSDCTVETEPVNVQYTSGFILCS